MIRVALISPCMGGYGGLEAFVLEVAESLHDGVDLAVEVFFKRAGDFRLQPELERRVKDSEISVCFCDRASWQLWRAVLNADLVHLQNACPDVVAMTRMARKPLLINVINHRASGRSLRVRLWRWCLGLAQRRFFISEFVRRSWEDEHPREGSQVAFPICRLSKLPPVSKEDRCGFVFVGRWIANKGIELLIEAYARAGLDKTKWPLKLLGDGPLRPVIEARVAELRLDCVEMPGFLSEHEKWESIRAAKFVVIPPHTNEDFGLVAIEARHFAVPCLITRDGGLPEAAGKFSLSCEPGDVEGLTRLLVQAASMTPDAYRELSEATYYSLHESLVHPAFYAQTYREMVHSFGNGMRSNSEDAPGPVR